MLIRNLYAAVVLCGVLTASLFGASDERKKIAQAVPFALRKRVIWKNLYNPRQRDQLYEPLNPLQTLPYKDSGFTLFFSRTPNLGHELKDMLDMDLVEKMAEELREAQVTFMEGGPKHPDQQLDDGDIEEADYDTAYDAYELAVENEAKSTAASIRRIADAMTFQEHRLGLGLAKEWREGHWYAAVRTWVGLAERNFWLDQEQRDDMANLMKKLFPEMDGKFDQSQFISMRWGIGDTHLQLGYIIPLVPRLELKAGLRGVIPTGRKVGLTAKSRMPLEADDLKDFFRDRIKEILIEPRFGNGGHSGLGVWADLTWNRLRPQDRYAMSAQLYGGIDYLFPAGHERFLLRREQLIVDGEGNELTGASLADHFETDDDDLRSYINQYAIPKPQTVVIAPGMIAQGGAVLQYRFERAGLFLGYDAYYRSEEEFVQFRDESNRDTFVMQQDVPGKNPPNTSNLRQSKEQYKIFGGISCNTTSRNVRLLDTNFKHIDWSFSVQGAFSVSSKNIGDDFVLGLSLGLRF